MAGLYHSGEDCHHLAAAITENRRAWWQRLRARYPHVQGQLQQPDQAFGIRMEEAKVPHPPEAAGQDVLEQQPEKLSARQGADLAVSLVVLIAEADLAITVGDDVFLRQYAAIEVAAQIAKRLLAPPHFLAVHHPCIRQGLLTVQACQAHGLKPLGSKHTREIGCPEEDLILLLFLSPSPAACVDGSGWHNQMHMGMVFEIAGMGVEYSMGTCAAAQMRIAAGKAVDRLPGGFKQQIIGRPLLGPEQSPQLRRYRDGDHEIVNRQ